MGKDSEKNLVGQPVFKQVMKILQKEKFDLLVKQCGSDRYYKSFFSWEQLVVMLFGIFSRCDSIGEVCDGMRALAGKLNYLGMDSEPSKSTAGDALRDRDNEGEGGGGTCTCHYYYSPGYTGKLICDSQYTCSYTYVMFCEFPDQCYEASGLPYC